MTTLDNLVVGTKSMNSVLPKTLETYSQIKVINLQIVGNYQITHSTTTAFVSVNFPVKAINVQQIFINTNTTATTDKAGIMYSNLTECDALGSLYMNSDFAPTNLPVGLTKYYVTPKHVNGTYDFWILDSTGKPYSLQTGHTWTATLIIEFIGDNSDQIPVSVS